MHVYGLTLGVMSDVRNFCEITCVLSVSTAGRGEVQGSNNTTGSLGGLNRRRCSSDAAVHQNHRHQQQQQQQRDVDADRRAMGKSVHFASE